VIYSEILNRKYSWNSSKQFIYNIF
jgi:hypothetical protein